MNVELIREYCLSFPDTTENIQWGDDLCFKVRGKIFVIVGLGKVPQQLCFKADPERFAELVEQEDIIPAPYLARYKWVLLQRLDVLRRAELEDLIGQSYDMVVAKMSAPKKPARSVAAGVKAPKRNSPVDKVGKKTKRVGRKTVRRRSKG